MTSITQQNPVRIFVSHVWEPSDDYFRVFEYLESSHNFYYVNCSRPDERPVGDKEAGRAALRQQINAAEVVILFSSLYRSSYEWAAFQLNCAKGLDKPVIVLQAFGVKEKLPAQLEVLGDEIIDWNDRTLVDAIRRQARHEETTRWDVVEFKL